jgi:hypothetical protein
MLRRFWYDESVYLPDSSPRMTACIRFLRERSHMLQNSRSIIRECVILTRNVDACKIKTAATVLEEKPEYNTEECEIWKDLQFRALSV